VFLSQPNQIERMLRDLGFDDSLKVAKSPINDRVRPSLDDATEEERKDPTVQSFKMQSYLGHINQIQPGRNIHVHARYFYVRDFVNEGEYAIHKLDTTDQLSDILVTYKDYKNFFKTPTTIVRMRIRCETE
jgi:hypothetical protein